MSKLTCAVIGTGHIAQTVHIPGFIAAAGTELTAICSRDIKRAKEIAKEYSVPLAFDTTDQLLKEAKPDIVVVCTPNAFHYDVVIKALRAGCHVFCEKPAATNYAHARHMAEVSIQADRLLAYNFPFRQKPETAVIKQRIAEDFFGTIYHINARFLRRRGIPHWGNFINKDIQGGGALMDIGIHILDLALHVLGFPPVKNVLASTYDLIGKQESTAIGEKWDHTKFTVEDACFAHLNFQNKSSITLQAAFALNTKTDRDTNMEIFGSKAGALLSPFELYRDKNGEAEIINTSFPEKNIQQSSIETFIKACEGTKTNICTATEGAQLQQLIEMMYSTAI